MLLENLQNIRVRFAPSPTGNLHIGGLRSAIFNWLFARKYKGKFLLRIEDTDQERSKAEYTESILESLSWANIDADEPIVIQSSRLQVHKEIIDSMIAAGTAYKCYCTPQELQSRVGASAETEGGYAKYDKKCRPPSLTEPSMSNSMTQSFGAFAHSERNMEQSVADVPYAVRFKIPEIENIKFTDLIRGEVTFDADQLDDFIIMRSDGMPMYNFVVVADDAFMNITHILRGEEHLVNTPKQILLYKALNYKIPEFGHLPLILGPSGSKLSKRDAAVSVLDYKNNGFMPDALCNYLVRLGWSHGDQEIFTRQELINYFSLDHVGKKGSIFDTVKLEWVNSVYIKDSDAQFLIEYIEKYIEQDFTKKFINWSQDQIVSAINLYKSRVKTLIELIDEIKNLYFGANEIAHSELVVWKDSQTKELIEKVANLLNGSQDFSLASLEESIKKFCVETNIKLPQIAKPLRVALVGKSNSPGIFELLALLGKQVTSQRLQRFATLITQGE